MKKLKRLAVGQLNEFERINFREQMNYVGGSGCVWKCLGYVMTYYDDLKKNENSSEWVNIYATQFKNAWKRFQDDIGGSILSSEDPAATQSDDLYHFLSIAFNTTTGATWGSSDWSGMLGASGAQNQLQGYNGSDYAIVMIGDALYQHALVIYGEAIQEGGLYYYKCYDPDGVKKRVYTNEILYGTGLSIKRN